MFITLFVPDVVKSALPGGEGDGDELEPILFGSFSAHVAKGPLPVAIHEAYSGR